MSPCDQLIESVEEDSEEAKDNDMESTDSSGNSHVGNEHGQGADKCVSHTVFSCEGTVESPVVGGELDEVIWAAPQSVVVVIVSESNSDPEASDDEVVLDGEDDDEEREEGG